MFQIKSILHSWKHSGVVFKKPGVIPRAVAGMFYGSLLKKSRLRIVEYVINSECDSKCAMCYATKYVRPDEKPLTVDEIRDSWEQCEKLGAFLAVLEGGEPSLHPQLGKVVEALKPERNIVVLVSNSLNLSYEYLKFLKEAGVAVLHLSLDGASHEINDPIRGVPGHWEKVMEAVENAKKLNLDVYFSSVLKRSNKDEYKKILELAKRLGVGISGALLINSGRYKNRGDERLREEDRIWLLNILKKYRGVLRFDWNNNFSGRYECPAGREKFSIGLYGDVMACVCNHLSFGNIRKESVKTIWERMNSFSFFKERNERCLVGFDTEYYHTYMEPIVEAENLPVSIFNHPTKPARLIQGKMIE